MVSDLLQLPFLFFPIRFLIRDQKAAEKWNNRRGKNQGKKPPVPPRIKNITGKQKQQILQAMIEKKVYRQYQEEEDKIG